MSFLSQLRWLLFSTKAKGRIGWKGYFLGNILSVLLIILLCILQITQDSLPKWPVLGIGVTCILLLIWMLSALAIKRLHDFGKGEGWFVFIILVPTTLCGENIQIWYIAMAIIFIVIGLLPGDKNKNKYGDPYVTLFPSGAALSSEKTKLDI